MAKNALRVGKPVDFSAEVPVYPPFALLAAFAASLLMWRLTGKRLRWLSWPIDSKWVRVAAFVGAVSVAVSVVDAAGKALRDAGSGINFVDVEGLATTFPFDATRNPMYACLLFVVTPALDRLALEASTEAAERSWTATKRFLRAVSAHAANCIDRYSALEYERVGARELRPKVDGWRSQVV